MNPCIELSENRIITIRAGDQRYDYTLAPIPARVWNAYFDAIVSSSERKGDQVIEEFDTSRARLALVGAALQSVSGYATADGQPVESQPNWKEKLPLKHRLAVADQLVRVGARDPEELGALTLGIENVMLTALWSANEDGIVLEYSHLGHCFDTPTADHYHRFQRDMSRSYVVGGTRTGKTIWRGAQKTLAAIYDELIQSVDGYSYSGCAIGREEIVDRMDTYHKVAAVGHLFRPVELAAEEAENR